MQSNSAFDLLIQCGISDIQQGNFDSAVHAFSQALQQTSDSVCAYANRAAAYYAQGNHESALNDLSRALELAPDLFTLYVNRGMIYRQLEDSERAAADFGQAIRLNPRQFWDCFDRMLILSSEYRSGHDPSDRSHSSNQSPSTRPHSSDQPPSSSQSPSDQSPSSNAQTRELPKPSPQASATYNLVGIVRPELNRNIFQLFQSINQFCANLKLELSEISHRKAEQDFFHFMIRLYDQAIAREPCNPLLYWDRSCLLSDTKQYEAAITDLNIAIQYWPAHPYLWLNRAVVHYRVLDLALALSDITRSMELNVDANTADANAYAYRAIILTGLQRFDEARADLDLAIQLTPHNSILLNLRNNLPD